MNWGDFTLGVIVGGFAVFVALAVWRWEGIRARWNARDELRRRLRR